MDISENNMAELVRSLRSSLGYGSGDFKTFAIDCGSVEFQALVQNEGPYDYMCSTYLRLSMLGSEKDPYTLMRLVMVNIFNTIKTIRLLKENWNEKNTSAFPQIKLRTRLI